jgi:hypothetical protein
MKLIEEANASLEAKALQIAESKFRLGEELERSKGETRELLKERPVHYLALKVHNTNSLFNCTHYCAVHLYRQYMFSCIAQGKALATS